MVAPQLSSASLPYSLPGVVITNRNVVTATVTADRIYYQPIVVSKSITVSAVGINVGTGGGASSKVIIGCYATTSAMQPTGSSLLTSGLFDVSGTGNKEASGLSVVLTPGVYLMSLATNGTGLVLSGQDGFVPGCSAWSSGFSTPSLQVYASRTYDGTNPTAVAWTTRSTQYAIWHGMVWTVN